MFYITNGDVVDPPYSAGSSLLLYQFLTRRAAHFGLSRGWRFGSIFIEAHSEPVVVIANLSSKIYGSAECVKNRVGKRMLH